MIASLRISVTLTITMLSFAAHACISAVVYFTAQPVSWLHHIEFQNCTRMFRQCVPCLSTLFYWKQKGPGTAKQGVNLTKSAVKLDKVSSYALVVQVSSLILILAGT